MLVVLYRVRPDGVGDSPPPVRPTDGPRKVPYTALYAFEGRSADEVSFQPGDTVMVGSLIYNYYPHTIGENGVSWPQF